MAQYQVPLELGMEPEGALLPKKIDRVRVPPIKCQGIKTKLVPFILSSIRWDGIGRWIEPFVGSGVVLLNLAPPRALAADTNIHIIRFFRDLASGTVTPEKVRKHLEYEGQLLFQRGERHYYEIRERFNTYPSTLDFIFLNRSCFNGVMRFNKKGEFNVPFCKKTDRFRRAYITKIVNQVAWVFKLVREHDWVFETMDWRETLAVVEKGDFVYADPPYLGRHTDYFNSWTENDAAELFERLRNLPSGFALSTWKQNKYRINPYLKCDLPDIKIKTIHHYYYVGAGEHLRNEMEEALVIKKEFAI